MSQHNRDTIKVFQCKQKEAQIKEQKVCYEAIPIYPEGFVKVENRIYMGAVKIRKCNVHFSLKIRAQEGWIELHPVIRKINPPKELPETRPVEHLDMAQGGIYTAEELSAWRHYLELGDVQKAISTL